MEDNDGKARRERPRRYADANIGKAMSRMGTRPLAEKTMMKATSWSSITRREPITPPTTDWAGSASERAGAGPVDEEVGSVRGATARERPDIAWLGV